MQAGQAISSPPASKATIRAQRVPFSRYLVCAPRPRCTAASSSSSQSSTADYKRAAAALLVDTFVKNGMTLGLGSGELCSLCIEEIGQRLASGQLQGVRGVATADTAAAEAAFHGVPLLPEDVRDVSLAIEQADQLDVEASACILGVAAEPRQPQLLQALAMAQKHAAQLVVLVESRNVVPRLGGTLPVLIEADGWEETAEGVDDIVLGDAEVWRRAVPGTPNPTPRGGDAPYLSQEGHHLLDLRYSDGLKLFGEPAPYHSIDDALLDIPGVVASGLLLGVASAAVVARPSGGPQVVQLAVDKAARGAEQGTSA